MKARNLASQVTRNSDNLQTSNDKQAYATPHESSRADYAALGSHHVVYGGLEASEKDCC
jgi:hypothetical protein